MKSYGFLFSCWFLTLLVGSMKAQNAPDAELIAIPEDPEVQKLDAQYRNLVAEQVRAIYEVPLQELTEQYVTLLQAEKKKTADAGELEKNIAWTTELARVTETEQPARPSTITVPRLVEMRAVYEKNAAPLRSGRAKKLSQLNALYLKALEGRERALTTEGAVDLAVEIRDWRLSQALPEVEGAGSDAAEIASTVSPPKSLTDDEIDEGEPGAVYTLRWPQGLEMKFSWCPPGTFTMGSPPTEEGRETMHGKQVLDESQREVEIEHGFWMAQTEVTQAQWTTLMGSTIQELQADLPARFTEGWFQLNEVGPDVPMYLVSIQDAEDFLKAMNREFDLHGWDAVLPTEEEWEYACRAGTTGPFAGDLDSMAWHLGNSDKKIRPVATKEPNAWKIYDMHGSLRELTEPSGSSAVARGGCYQYAPHLVRSAMRFNQPTSEEIRLNTTGFRVLLRPD